MDSASPMTDTVLPPDPIEALVARTRPSAEGLFRRYKLSPDDASTVLFQAFCAVESPHGLVPGAGQRLINGIETASRRLSGKAKATKTEDYGPTFEALLRTIRSRRTATEQEARRCAHQVARLEAVAGGDTEVLLSDPELRPSKELVRALLDRSREVWKSDALLSLTLARRALATLTRLGDDEVDGRFLADLQARSHVYSANALRLLCDYRSSEKDFDKAQAALSRGTQDPRERAQMLSYLAHLRADQRRFSEALRHLQQAAAIYRWTRERHSEGLIHMKMATTQASAGRPELALPHAERARELLDHQRDARMSAGLEMNIAHYLFVADRPEEARQQLRVARPRVASAGSPKDLRGLQWIEGQIALALGDREEGERLLTDVREEYVRSGQSYEAALVSLELVAEYLERGRAGDAKRLAAESLPIFQSLEVHRETLAALIALQRATELETATAGVVRELLERLRRGSATPPRPEKPS